MDPVEMHDDSVDSSERTVSDERHEDSGESSERTQSSGKAECLIFFSCSIILLIVSFLNLK